VILHGIIRYIKAGLNEKFFTRATNCISKAGADDTHFTRVVNQMSNASSPCSINDSFIINPKHISASTLHEESSTTFWRSPFFLSFDMLAMQQLPKQTNTYKNIPISIL